MQAESLNSGTLLRLDFSVKRRQKLATQITGILYKEKQVILFFHAVLQTQNRLQLGDHALSLRRLKILGLRTLKTKAEAQSV